MDRSTPSSRRTHAPRHRHAAVRSPALSLRRSLRDDARMKNAGRPQAGEFASYYQRYVDLATEDDIVAALDAQSHETATLLGGISEQQAAYRYEPDKWSVKQIVGHVIDGERVFAYRALCISRGGTTPLPGFEQDPYVANAASDDRPIADLAEELAT